MKYLMIILLMTGLLLTSSCDKAVSHKPTDPELLAKKLSFPFNIVKAKEGALATLRTHVKALIDDRKKNMKEDLFDLTYYYIVPQYVSNENVIDAGTAYNRHWLKFDNNYTFKYGIGPDQIGTGTFHYAPSDQRLLMLDDDPLVEPKMWSILANSEFMNFLGHPLLVARDRNNNEFLIQSNFANDNYLNQVGSMIAEAHNGMQIKMMLLENPPL